MNSLDIRDYLQPLLKWRWLLVAVPLVAALSSFVYTYMQPAVYEARTTVSVGKSYE